MPKPRREFERDRPSGVSDLQLLIEECARVGGKARVEAGTKRLRVIRVDGTVAAAVPVIGGDVEAAATLAAIEVANGPAELSRLDRAVVERMWEAVCTAKGGARGADA